MNSDGTVSEKKINYDPSQDDRPSNQKLYKICMSNINKIDSAKFDDNIFAISCVGDNNSEYKNLACVDYETFGNDNISLDSKFIHTND